LEPIFRGCHEVASPATFLRFAQANGGIPTRRQGEMRRRSLATYRNPQSSVFVPPQTGGLLLWSPSFGAATKWQAPRHFSVSRRRMAAFLLAAKVKCVVGRLRPTVIRKHLFLRHPKRVVFCFGAHLSGLPQSGLAPATFLRFAQANGGNPTRRQGEMRRRSLATYRNPQTSVFVPPKTSGDFCLEPIFRGCRKAA